MEEKNRNREGKELENPTANLEPAQQPNNQVQPEPSSFSFFRASPTDRPAQLVRIARPAAASARPRVRVRPLPSGPLLSAPFPAAHASPSHCSAGPTCHLPPPALPQRPTEISGRNHRDLPSRAGPRDLRSFPFKPPADPQLPIPRASAASNPSRL